MTIPREIFEELYSEMSIMSQQEANSVYWTTIYNNIVDVFIGRETYLKDKLNLLSSEYADVVDGDFVEVNASLKEVRYLTKRLDYVLMTLRPIGYKDIEN